MNTRLKQFLAAENITQSQFADKIEVVRASVSHVLSGRNNPSYEFIKAIMAKYPTLNIEWLIFGKGKMYKESTGNDHFKEGELFDDLFSETELRHHEPLPVADPVNSPSIISQTEAVQETIRQRSVSKIIVLFDDGSYQEL